MMVVVLVVAACGSDSDDGSSDDTTGDTDTTVDEVQKGCEEPKEATPMSPIAGELVTEELEYDGGRSITVYVPPDPVDAVVYAADGGMAHLAPE